MRAADNKGPLPPTSPPNFSTNDSVVENPQHAYRRRCQQGPMRVESSTMSDPSCGLQRAALGDECVAEGSEGEEPQTTPTVDPRTEEEEEEEEDEMTKSVNLHRELQTKRREVSHLVDEMQRLQSSINNLKEMSTSKIAQLQDMVSEKDRVIKDLAEKLLRQQDYTDLKRELRLLKALDAGAWQSWNSEPLEDESPTNEKSDDTNGNRMTPTSGDESLGEDPAPSSTPPAADSVSSAHLQRCLRLNVDRFGCEPLNTLSVSRCVRELLSVNNIGQRLFAKLVLGLSQGTVSELLSRPKPWDKLTEKGRDSYRKMHAWACDQQCVMLLKAMLPKKGRDGKLENEDRQVPAGPDLAPAPPPPTSEEANNVASSTVEVPTPPKEVRQQPPHHHPLGLGYADVGNGKGLCHFAEFPPVMLAHLYQEELLKLIGKRMKDCQQPADQAKQAEDEIRRALSIYHRELTMMAAHQCHARRAPDSTTTCGAAFGCREPACCMTQPEHAGYFPSDSMKVLSPYSTGSPLIPLPPEGGGGQQAMSGGEDTSPLQRMQSITNSLLAAAGQGFGAQQFAQQRPSKAVLPPITQQQFDHYSNLNTEDIVKRVKEQLSQYSISQRLFGESVLGLSQGSVSDLLARPKPWHMLTQKGREPFIRMKMFLEDENAVHKLVASQYKIAPERLMRMGGYGGVPSVTPQGTNRFSPVGPASEPPYPSQRGGPQPKLPRPCSPPSSPSAPLSPSPGRGARGPFVQPSVYEMAAVTTDLDTQIITARIKETLTVHNIGQKLFGEAVLGLSQGSVSELLSKPKPWHMLSIKGREPFIRMQLWLNDPANVEKLQAIKTERREANKRRRNAIDPEGACVGSEQPPPCPLDAALFLYHPSSKKPRMLFSEEQKEALKLAYTLDPYPSTAVMEFLSAELGLSVGTITNWFHNHRMRLKQQNQEPDVPYPNPESMPSTFDPIRFRLLLGQRLAEMCKANSQMLPYFSVPHFGMPQTIGKIDIDNTLDLSVSSQQYPKKDDQKEEEERKHNPPKLTASSAIDLTDKSTNKDIELTDNIRPDKFNVRNSPSEFSSSASAKASLDLSFSTLQKLAVQELASSVTTTPADTTSRNSTPDIDSLFRTSTKQEEDFPVDLREDKRCNPMNSGSNRRKPAAPQWVDPGLDLSPDSDIFEEDAQENQQEQIGPGQVINGICVRQSDPFQERLKQFQCRPLEDEKSKLEREQNIRRLERAIADHEEGWDDISDDDDDACL